MVVLQVPLPGEQIIERSCGTVNFEPVCDQHDRDCQECGMPKTQSDTNFLGNLNSVCNSTFANDKECRDACKSVAGTYYTVVDKFDSFPYSTAQKKACICC